MTEQLHWEHGYRCHGYHVGVHRVGFVGLPPYCGGLGSTKENGYGWGLDSDNLQNPPARPKMKTLSAAKRAVERAYQEYLNARY